MTSKYEMNQGGLRVFVPVELDHHLAENMRKELDIMIENHGIRRIIFDFSETEFMDSSGIGVIIGRCRSMEFGGGTVELTNLNARVERIVKLSGLDRIVKIT